MNSVFDIVVATDLHRGIGKQGVLPWRLPLDLKHFKELTCGTGEMSNAVIMGRKTWESIPVKYRPFSGRLNIVLTKSVDYKVPDGVKQSATLDEALIIANNASAKLSFVIGGGQIYDLAVKHPSCRMLYLTEINSDFKCDTFFPEYKHLFSLVSESEIFTENDTKYSFKILKKL